MPFKPRKPDYRIKARTKDEDGHYQTGEVGIAWRNETGNLSIRLNPGVVLRWDDGLILTAFPVEEKGDG